MALNEYTKEEFDPHPNSGYRRSVASFFQRISRVREVRKNLRNPVSNELGEYEDESEFNRSDLLSHLIERELKCEGVQYLVVSPCTSCSSGDCDSKLDENAEDKEIECIRIHRKASTFSEIQGSHLCIQATLANKLLRAWISFQNSDGSIGKRQIGEAISNNQSGRKLVQFALRTYMQNDLNL